MEGLIRVCLLEAGGSLGVQEGGQLPSTWIEFKSPRSLYELQNVQNYLRTHARPHKKAGCISDTHGEGRKEQAKGGSRRGAASGGLRRVGRPLCFCYSSVPTGSSRLSLWSPATSTAGSMASAFL